MNWRLALSYFRKVNTQLKVEIKIVNNPFDTKQNKEYSVAELRKMLDEAEDTINKLNSRIKVLSSTIKELGGEVPGDKDLEKLAF